MSAFILESHHSEGELDYIIPDIIIPDSRLNANTTDSTATSDQAECSCSPAIEDYVAVGNSTTIKRIARKRKKGDELLNTTYITGPDCKCKWKCFTAITDSTKAIIISTFNAMESKEVQDIHLSGQIRISPVQRRRPKTGAGQTRAYAAHYKVKHGTIEQKVCKKAFCSLYGVGKRRVERIIGCLQEGRIPVLSDDRGKHGNRPNKKPDDVIAKLDEHIRSFPTQVSQCSVDKNESVRYLSPDLSVRKMHRLYLEKYEPEIFAKLGKGEECKPIVSYHYFHRHFNENYKLSFGALKADTCQNSDELESQIKLESNPET